MHFATSLKTFDPSLCTLLLTYNCAFPDFLHMSFTCKHVLSLLLHSKALHCLRLLIAHCTCAVLCLNQCLDTLVYQGFPVQRQLALGRNSLPSLHRTWVAYRHNLRTQKSMALRATGQAWNRCFRNVHCEKMWCMLTLAPIIFGPYFGAIQIACGAGSTKLVMYAFRKVWQVPGLGWHGDSWGMVWPHSSQMGGMVGMETGVQTFGARLAGQWRKLGEG